MSRNLKCSIVLHRWLDGPTLEVEYELEPPDPGVGILGWTIVDLQVFAQASHRVLASCVASGAPSVYPRPAWQLPATCINDLLGEEDFRRIEDFIYDKEADNGR